MLRLLLAALAALQGDPGAALVDRLRSDRPEEREAADRELRALGRRAVGALARSAGDPDFEVALRVRRILDSVSREPALEMMGRLEEAATGARSLRVRVSLKTVGQDPLEPQSEATGELLLKAPRQIRSKLEGSVRGIPFSLGLCSDGRKTRSWAAGLPAPWNVPVELEADDELVGDLAVGTVRAGVWAALTLKMHQCYELSQGRPLSYDRGLKRLILLPEPTLGYEEELGSPLRYRYNLRGGSDYAHVLRFDGRHLLLLGREIRVSQPAEPEGSGAVEVRWTTETYAEYVLNADLPDSVFALPPG